MFRKAAGENTFTLALKKWIEATNAIGIISKSGRYHGTFAHKDIAFEFVSWISAEFKLYIIKQPTVAWVGPQPHTCKNQLPDIRTQSRMS